MKKKILLIQDHGQDRDLALYLLESRGYQVIPAADGALGIEMADFHQPQLILLDIHLSSMDGGAVAHALRNHPALESIPVVVVTLRSHPGDREQLGGSGCAGHMERPFDPQTFIAEIERHLQQTRARKKSRLWSWLRRRTTRTCVPPAHWAFIPQ